MIDPKPWEIWYADFDFEELDNSKDRPVLVLEIDGVYYVSAMITKHEKRGVWGEVDVTMWRAAGLSEPSTIRLSRIQELIRADFRRKVGELSMIDIGKVQEKYY